MADRVFVLHGDVVDGRLRLDNQPDLLKWLAKLPSGQRLRAVIEPTELDRRGRLRTFYRFVLLRQAGESIGVDPLDLHLWLWQHLRLEPSAGLSTDLDGLNDQQLSRFVQDSLRVVTEKGAKIEARP